MNSGKNTPSIDPSWKGVIKWGGLSLLVSGAIAVLFFVLVIATVESHKVVPGKVSQSRTGLGAKSANPELR